MKICEIIVHLLVIVQNNKIFTVQRIEINDRPILTLNLLTTTIVAPPSNASKWQMGFNSAFKGLIPVRKCFFLSASDQNTS